MMHRSSSTASGLAWQPRVTDSRAALTIAQQHGVSELLAGILAGRGVTPDDVSRFLNPSLREDLPDPFHLRDMDKAVERVLRAIYHGERIGVFGDYDVDGATSTTLLMDYLGALGVEVIPYIPDRMKEGYGPSVAAFEKLITPPLAGGERGVSLILTVDCGTLGHAAIAFAQAREVDVIVLDHHASDGALPTAHAIVNPNRVDETSPYTNLAAVGVTFLFLVGLNQRVKESRVQSPESSTAPSLLDSRLWTLSTPLPNLLSFLDLVALGTVCDVMPLTGLNRTFVAQGLKVMGQRRRLGLSVLSDVSRMDESPNVYHLGFLLGPRINAGGRVGKANLGVELLASTDAEQAHMLAAQLDQLNSERQAIEADVFEKAQEIAQLQANQPVILVAGEGWHPGVIGIVAGRLKEAFQRPAIVVSFEAGQGKASGRSVPGADMGAAIHAAVAAGILEKGGGHAMAAGFSIAQTHIAELHAFLIARMEAAVNIYSESRVRRHDGALSVSGATLSTLDDIAAAGPFGLGNPGPRFVIPRARILNVGVMKEKHLRLTLGDDSGAARLNAVAFSAVGTQLGDWLMQEKRLDLLGELKRNAWQGRESTQFMIEDAAKTA